MLNAFTVDVEDYYQVSAFEDQIDRKDWPSYPSRVVNNTHRLLDLLDRHATKATFFILGWTAREFPHLVEEIRDRGHEIGSHSFWHRLVYHQTPDEFRIDLRDSLKAIEDAAGVRGDLLPCPQLLDHQTIANGHSTSWPKRAFRSIPASTRSITIATACPTRNLESTDAKRIRIDSRVPSGGPEDPIREHARFRRRLLPPLPAPFYGRLHQEHQSAQAAFHVLRSPLGGRPDTTKIPSSSVLGPGAIEST